MTKEDKQRVIGKVVGINSDRFTVELLSGIDNFNINGFDDIHYFAQLNSYVVIPYQNYYIVAEVSGVREKDMNVPFNNPTEQILSKIKSGKFLEVLPIGTLRQRSDEKIGFEFGVSVYPALYTDALYIKEKELDAIFNIQDKYETICQNEECEKGGKCDCKNKRYLTLSIGKSTIFPDYDVKIDINKFFGSHSAVLGNTGSGKSCTISAITQEIFYNHKNYSAVGSTFIFFDVNGEYKQAFSKLNEQNPEIVVSNFTVGEPETGDGTFNLPHWFLNINEWGLLLQATEKTQFPILRNALGIATVFETDGDVREIKNHILASCITQILRDDSGTPSKSDRITSILQKFGTDEIDLKTSFSVVDEDDFTVTGTIEECLAVTYGEMRSIDKLLSYLNSKDKSGDSRFFSRKFKMPVYDEPQKFQLENLDECLDLALLYEEAHGNRQIRDYCSSLITRLKSILDRSDFKFLKATDTTLEKYQRRYLGLYKKGETIRKRKQVIVIDLSSVEDEIVEVISCVLSRIIYESLKQMKLRNNYPVNLILEEAHRYIGDSPNTNFLRSNKIFEQIAKEGRKFGMFLIVSSQRPSELSKTVLSQCNNFIVHRIQNPEDLSHIRQITPHISEAILRRMPSIPTQTALIFGHAVNLPTMFKVKDADPRPKSDNNKISENWFRPEGFEVNNLFE